MYQEKNEWKNKATLWPLVLAAETNREQTMLVIKEKVRGKRKEEQRHKGGRMKDG